ncbi:MAG TPA: enoyl-CoA hydratase-related protein [Polyangia bacterium]|nr:enoyl-CoA hydratase-related protein [Polyangia bacterium]
MTDHAPAKQPPATPEELLIRDDGAVRWISLHRPASKNGLTVALNQRIIAAFEDAAAAESVRCVVLTGEGGNFCSGLDLKSAMSEAEAMQGEGVAEERMNRYFHGLIRAVVRCPKPVIALIDGAAVGFGCDLALACDLRLGTPRARLGEIFVKRGLMPDGGGTFFLPRLVGTAKAFELMMTGDVIEAEEALRLGLVNRLVPVEQAVAETAAFAKRLCEGAPLVQAWIKRAVYGALGGTLEDALALERQGQMQLLRSADFAEGLLAFFEKRPPRFTGR